MKFADLSSLVVQARKAQRLTQRELQDLSGISISVIHKIENGRGDLSLKSILAVLNSLGFQMICRSPLGEEIELDG
jgi:transcriptional regulator with XRE-family HTH domain